MEGGGRRELPHLRGRPCLGLEYGGLKDHPRGYEVIRRTRWWPISINCSHKAASYLTDHPHVPTTVQSPPCQKSAALSLDPTQLPTHSPPDLRLRETFQPRCSTLENLAICCNPCGKHIVLRFHGQISRQRKPSKTPLQKYQLLFNALLNPHHPRGTTLTPSQNLPNNQTDNASHQPHAKPPTLRPPKIHPNLFPRKCLRYLCPRRPRRGKRHAMRKSSPRLRLHTLIRRRSTTSGARKKRQPVWRDDKRAYQGRHNRANGGDGAITRERDDRGNGRQKGRQGSLSNRRLVHPLPPPKPPSS